MEALQHRLLRQFLTVADTGTVRAAAASLHMSQPPLTAAVRLLEERLGVRLFDRSVKGMRLTPAGEALAADARRILGALSRAEARTRQVGGEPQRLRIGFVSAALNGALTSLLRTLVGRGEPAPDLFELTTPDQLERLEAGALDLGLLHPPVPDLPDLELRSLGRDPFCAALPDGHAFASRTSVRFAEIVSEPFVLFPEAQGPVLRARLREAAAACGRELEIVAEARRVHSQLAIVSGGLGIGLVTRNTAETLNYRGVTVLPIEDAEDSLYLELAALGEPTTLERLGLGAGPDCP